MSYTVLTKKDTYVKVRTMSKSTFWVKQWKTIFVYILQKFFYAKIWIHILIPILSIVAPEVSTKAALIGVVENGPVNLVCTANAYPKAMVEWMRYGSYLKYYRNYSMIIFFCLIYIFYKDSVVRSNGAWKVNETEVSIFSKRKTLQINR